MAKTSVAPLERTKILQQVWLLGGRACAVRDVSYCCCALMVRIDNMPKLAARSRLAATTRPRLHVA